MTLHTLSKGNPKNPRRQSSETSTDNDLTRNASTGTACTENASKAIPMNPRSHTNDTCTESACAQNGVAKEGRAAMLPKVQRTFQVQFANSFPIMNVQSLPSTLHCNESNQQTISYKFPQLTGQHT
jgi:hypothetical protein